MNRPQTPENALATIAGWSGPDIAIEPISGGLRNACFRVTRGSRACVLRLPGPDADAYARDFDLERRVQARAAERGLAPSVVHADTTRGLLMSEYLPGRSWNDNDLHDPHRLAALSDLLRRVHELPQCGASFRAVAATSGYLAALPQEHPQRTFAMHCVEVVRNMSPQGPRRCCHNDVVAGNVIEGSDLRLIDWEYASDNEPFFDLASIVGWHDLDSERVDTLLRAYAGGTGSEVRGRLASQCRRYDAIQWLWLAARQQHASSERQAARLELVRKRLL